MGYITTTGTKSQAIRLVDIFIIGPLMIYLGYIGYLSAESMFMHRSSIININIGKLLYLGLIFFGSTTITYNARNYLAQSR
jgi:hypothetical protein